MGSFISFIAGFFGALGKIVDLFTTRQHQQEGANAQSQRDTATTEVVQDRIVQAVADAPKTKSEALDRLRHHDA